MLKSVLRLAPALCLAASLPALGQIPTGVTFESFYDQAKIGFLQPTFVGPVPGDAGQLIVVERAGKVWRLVNGAAGWSKLAWFSVDANTATHWDGAWTLEFHPRFASNRLFYVLYRLKNQETKSVIEEWTCDAGFANPRKVRNIIFFNQKSIHSSGDLHFGKDGYLYSAQGDRNQLANGGQLMSEMWGKVIRIDVDKKDPGLEYAIPDNPFKGQANTRPEIWASGFRMPWRFSFDALNGDMYLGDVGDVAYEEVNLVQAGKNYGAGKVEGACKTNCAGLTNAVADLPHGCVIGGFVYRNDPASAFYGAYIYADFQINSLNAFKINAEKTGVTDQKKIAASTPGRIAALGVDAAGNIYAATYIETSATTPTHIFRLKHTELRPATVGLKGAPPLPAATLLDPAKDGWRAFSLDGKPLVDPRTPGLRLVVDPRSKSIRAQIALP